jgi:hypothetical protein
MDLFKPRGSASIRNPLTDQQQNGQITNPPRFAHLGGLDSPKKAANQNKMTIVPPGNGKRVI